MAKQPAKEPAAEKMPVVLVHGFLSTAEMLAPLASKLMSKGFDVHPADLSPFCIQDVRQLAEQLSKTVDKVLDETDAQRCHLVGMSQGGIIALYYAKVLDDGSRVHKIVAAGSPFQGTWAPVAGLLSAPLLGVVSRGVWQVMPNSALLNEIHTAPLPDGVEVTTIAAEGDLVSPSERCRLPDTRHIVVSGLPLVSHQWLVFSQPVADAIAEVLSE